MVRALTHDIFASGHWPDVMKTTPHAYMGSHRADTIDN
jgi:hypothetical protein